MKPRNGSKTYKGIQVPINAQIHTWHGRECYLSGIDGDYKIVRFIDTGEVEKVRI